MEKLFDTIGGYPSPLVSNEDKAKKEYGLQYFKKMYSDWRNNTDMNFQDRRRRNEKLRKYAEGTQSVSKYKDLLDAEGDTSYMNIDWTPVSIVPKFVDVVCGGMVEQDHKVKATAIDPVSVDTRRNDQKELLAKMLTAEMRAQLTELTGDDYIQKGYTPNSYAELDLYMSLNYKQRHELAMEEGISFVLQTNDFDELKRKLIRDLVVVGQASMKCYLDKTQGVKIRYVDPTNLVTSYSGDPDFKNIQHAGEIYTVTISELKRMAGDQFTEEEYRKIAEDYGNKNIKEDYPYSRTFSASGDYSYEYDKFSVEIMDAEFITSHDIKYEKKKNKFGGYSVRKRKSNYKPPKKSKLKREQLGNTVKVVYSGIHIVGTDYIFNYGLAKNMSRPKSNLTETKLSYIIYSPNLYKMNTVSLVQRMIPFADQIQLAHLKLQQLLAKARPKGAAFEVGSLENVTKGDGGTFTPLELQEIYDQTGNIYYRSLDDEGNPSGASPVQELENGIGRDMMSLIQIYNHNLQMIRDVTGVNEARDGAKPSSEALVGVQKLQLMASNNATRSINDGFLHMVKKLGESATMKLQDLVEYDKPLKGYISAIGRATMKTIEIGKDVSLHEFGIAIEIAPDEQEKAMLEQNIQASLQQKELRIEDAIMIRQLKNVKLANRMLILRRQKYQEDIMKQQMQASEANALQQQQSVQAASQAKQQEIQATMQLDQAKMQADAQIQENLMRIEYELKNEHEEKAHIRKMKEIELANIGKVASGKIQSEARKGTVAKSAHYQSQMIEQRKGNQGPIQDPQMMS